MYFVQIIPVISTLCPIKNWVGTQSDGDYA